MKKRKLKNKIALVLSAGMVLSLPAPAMPVYAADSSISFNMGQTYAALGGTPLQGLSGTQGSNTNAASNPGGLPVDSFANNQSTTSGGSGYIEMPFWNYQWLDGSGANLPSPTPPLPSGYNFPGYLLKGWYAQDPEKNPSQTRLNHLPKFMPYKDITYYAAFVADPNAFFKFKQLHENADANTHAPLTTNGTFPVSTTVLTAPSATDNSVNTIADSNTMNLVSARPLNIYGYKGEIKAILFSANAANPVTGSMAADLTTTGDYGTGKYIDPGTLVDGREDEAAQYRFVYSAAGQSFSGNMVNRDLTTVMKYSVDNTQKSRLTVVHEVKDANGNVVSTESEFNHTFAAEETITGIAPKSSLLTPPTGNPESRYKLQAATFVNEGTVAAYKHTMLTINQARYGGPLADTDTSALALLDQTVDSNGFLTSGVLNAAAKMPNQGVTVKYTYVPNPAYRINVKTKYVSQEGVDLTPLVATKASKTVGDDGMIETLGSVNTSITIPYPNLNADGYGTPTFSISGGTPGTAGVVPDLPNNVAAADLGSDSYVVTVTYPRLPGFWAQIMFQTEGNGSLEDPAFAVGTNHPYDNSNANAINVPVNTDNSVDIPLTTVLPHAVAGAGYEFKGYFDVNTGTQVTDATGAYLSTTPYHLADPGAGLVAKFEHSSSWLDFTFRFDGSHGDMTPAGPVTGSIYPFDLAGNPRVIQWADLDPDDPAIAAEFIGVRPSASADAGYVIKWYHLSGTRLVEINNATDVAQYPNGSVFVARAVSTSPLTLDQPTVDASINSTTGAAEIIVSSFNSDPTVNYIVADASGRIVAVVSNNELQANGGVISGNGILPDTAYTVYEAAPDANPNVGDNVSSVSSSMLSAPLSSGGAVTTPIALTPSVQTDPADPNLNQMVLSPVTPGQQYAVIDDQGNVVANWTTPSGNTLTVPGLTPGRRYSLVTRPTSDTTSTPESHNGLDFVAADLKNIITVVNPSDIRNVSPAGLDLENVPAGTVVELSANPISGSNVFTSNWEFVLGRPLNLSNDGSTTIRFTMPKGRIVVKALYENDLSNWAPISGNDAIRSDGAVGQPGSVGVENPLLNIAGNFRVVVNRTRVSNADRASIQDTITDETYTGLWSIVAKVQQEVGGTWQDYADPTLPLSSYVNMGALEDSGRTYMLHHLASGSNADRLSDAESQVNPVSGFDGLFRYNFLNGEKYVFGYSSVAHMVKFVDVITGNTVATAQVTPGKALNTAASQYRSVIPAAGAKVEDRNTGLTWTYVGLKKTANGTGNVSETDIINADTTVYIYYTNDQAYRDQLVSGLNDSLSKADKIDTSKYNAADVAALQAKVAEARALLAKAAPNMAVSSELAKVLEELNAILRKFGVSTTPVPTPDNNNNNNNNNNGGGGRGGRGGSGGGGGSSRKNADNKAKTGLKVGYDGNWELINYADAQNNLKLSKWVFNLTNGGKLTGWAYLNYTYEGQTKAAWYHFGSDNIMNTGWFHDDATNKWYYLSTDNNGFFGEMKTGWILDAGRWYYLNPSSGEMLTGWVSIANEFYYLNTSPGQAGKPYGAMYQSERTPDGYNVNERGVWN